jgi:putative endonuclease
MAFVAQYRYFVYIMASRSHHFYVGVTNDIARRVHQHKNPDHDCFTAKYHINRLVWYQAFDDIHLAISREKQIKNWRRDKKVFLIERNNPTWQELSEE